VGKSEVGKWLMTILMDGEERSLVVENCVEMGGFLERVLRGL
jgi:hypothetical protein